MIKISKGLDIPISGMPSNEVENSAVRSVGVVASDYPGLKPTMMVNMVIQFELEISFLKIKKILDLLLRLQDLELLLKLIVGKKESFLVYQLI